MKKLIIESIKVHRPKPNDLLIIKIDPSRASIAILERQALIQDLLDTISKTLADCGLETVGVLVDSTGQNMKS